VRYKDDFHADILGCRTASGLVVPGSVEVPDRETPTYWKDSNPRGFADWFTRRSQIAAEERYLAKALPLPSNWAADAKTVLQRIVQLAKRQRDMVFAGNDTSPRSIVLTTLQATAYQGQLSVYEALVEALDSIATMTAQASPRRLVVLNPMNSGEDFSETWDDPAHYLAFIDWLLPFRERVHALRHIEGIENLTRALSVLFGENVSKHATHRYQEALAAARSSNELRAGGTAIVTGTANSRVVPRNHNFGADY